MEESRFDAWTRRRFGLALGGGLAALGLGARGGTVAGKKKKKRCRKLKQACQSGNRNRKCCNGLTCGESVAIPEGAHCCRKAQGICSDASECCSPALCDDGKCCFLEDAGPCTEDGDCCDELLCNTALKTCAQPA